ncbi:hypothetical protein HPB48_026158 [Haemaphysalis longicornis]|uniref:Uncharacterized protein n=1 Tax=Haemaphysalis longicornis TaxID=44386 RepID=A0A9J6HBQ3_HAELO|nr:hypothetical protein HPB48_026158 [Haemaphysalis longicornis]
MSAAGILGRALGYNIPDLSLTLNREAIPAVITLRILGDPYDYDGYGTAYLPKLRHRGSQLTHT